MKSAPRDAGEASGADGRVVNIAKLRAILEDHRQTLLDKRNHAETPEGKLVHVGALRELGNVESILLQESEVSAGVTLPLYSLDRVPASAEQLAGYLISEWRLPANFPDFRYASYLDYLLNLYPDRREQILFLNRCAKQRDFLTNVFALVRGQAKEAGPIVVPRSVTESAVVAHLATEVQPPAAPELPADTEVVHCPACNKPFRYRKALETHVAKFHAGTETEIAPNDSQEAILPPILVPAEEEIVTADYTCPACAKVFRYPKALANHLASKHPDFESGERFACPSCGKIYRYKKALDNHVAAAHA
jgi:uncharacterized C2H2 Zn-finger protein